MLIKYPILATKANLPPFNPIHLKINWGDIGHVSHYPGKCARSHFYSGAHRTGFVPVLSLLDGGLPGDIERRVCIDCGKVFAETVFRPKDQPSTSTRMRGPKVVENEC
jgi:hypothetical protein